MKPQASGAQIFILYSVHSVGPLGRQCFELVRINLSDIGTDCFDKWWKLYVFFRIFPM